MKRIALAATAILLAGKFPPDQRERFNTSVSRGKNQMPPWGDMPAPGDLDGLWAYVIAGER